MEVLCVRSFCNRAWLEVLWGCSVGVCGQNPKYAARPNVAFGMLRLGCCGASSLPRPRHVSFYPTNMSFDNTLTCLGAMVAAMNLMPFVGDKEYLHISLTSRNMREAYGKYTTEKTTTALGVFTSASQLKCHVELGYDGVDEAMNTAARWGRVDLMECLFSIGVPVTDQALIPCAAEGNLQCLEWCVSADAIPVSRINTSVNGAALDSGHLNVFRWCIEQHWCVKMCDLEHSVSIGDEEHMKWALEYFPLQSSTIAIGIANSDMQNAFELYKRVDKCAPREARDHFFNFLGAFQGGNIAILTYIAERLWSASIDVDSEKDWFVALGARLRDIDNNREQYYGLFNESAMAWAKQDPVLRRFM